MGMPDILQTQAKYRARKAKGKARSNAGGNDGSGKPPIADKGEKNDNDVEGTDAQSGFQWVATKCWVKCNMNEEPISPYVYGGPCDRVPKPGSAPQSLHVNTGTDIVPAGSSVAASSSVLAALLEPVLDRIKVLTEPKQIEVKLPKVALAQIVTEWTPPVVEHKRHRCPIPHNSSRDFNLFMKYLQGEGLKPETININMLNLKRFFNLLVVEEGPHVVIGTMCAIYYNDLMAKIMEAPLMHLKYTWSRNIVTALDHLCNHLKIECNKKRWNEAHTTLQQLVDEVLSVYNKQGLKCRTEADSKKKRLDASRLQNFPALKTIKAALQDAMIGLGVLSKRRSGHTRLGFSERLNSTTAMVGIIYYNSFAGRSGEWETMTHEHVLTQLSAGADHLLCNEHKVHVFLFQGQGGPQG